MYGYQCMILKEINIILVSVVICSIVDNLINTSTWRKRNKCYSPLIQKWFVWKEISTCWQFKNKIFKMCSAPNQHSCVIVLRKFLSLVISLLSEWNTDSTAAFPYKNLSIQFEIYFKWNPRRDNCGSIQIHKLYCWNITSTGTGHWYNDNNILVLIISFCCKPFNIDPFQRLI